MPLCIHKQARVCANGGRALGWACLLMGMRKQQHVAHAHAQTAVRCLHGSAGEYMHAQISCAGVSVCRGGERSVWLRLQTVTGLRTGGWGPLI